MSAAKLIVQIVITGTRIVSRAFVDAYRAASAASKDPDFNINVDAQAKGTNRASFNADPLSKKTGISLQEAKQILNLENKQISLDSVLQKYDNLYKMNDPIKGGSPYLQAKIEAAKERIELELKNKK